VSARHCSAGSVAHNLVLHHAPGWFEVDVYEHKGLCGCWLEMDGEVM